jgi:GNAT superfamily N-acetyltransferase
VTVTVAKLTGDELRARLDDLAKLRIEIFRAWPYLYKGTMRYERQYLPRYAEAKTGTMIVAEDDGKIVGASTALGLDEEDEYVQQPFLDAKMGLNRIFYFGESVLLPGYRGQGVGGRFFELREEAARGHGYKEAAFCAVVRPDDHPARPRDYVKLDGFWKKRGYVRRPELVAKFNWRDIGERNDSEKPMVFWMKTL